ncbi:zinc-binding dehydrogenase [Mycobacterium sp.]|uniref:zinc-binding dehydrogenase n=1 Tax=Mycobacterium sp. TaxID=1785 RepID=UPI002CAE0B6C|nr:zinc-binding dehydrogenase [Mycobacterium sp.]HTY33069.1 zinc-binding dehydrogenase [Mycobacterium sp.]
MSVTDSPLLPTAPAVVREQSGGDSMRAIILNGFGGLDTLVYTEIPKPLPKDGEVVIAVKGFGINHAEMHMRRGEWAEAEELGAARVELERRDLAAQLPEANGIDAILDLVGNSTILDSLDMLRRGGTACLAGWLGGLAPIGDFNPLLRMASGVNWNFFGSFVFGTPSFPLSDVPLQDIARQVAEGRLEAKPSRVFPFGEIREAHRLMESGEAGGKLVVVME